MFMSCIPDCFNIPFNNSLYFDDSYNEFYRRSSINNNVLNTLRKVFPVFVHFLARENFLYVIWVNR